MRYKSNKDAGRKADGAPLKDALKELFKAYGIDGKYNQARIIAFWEQTMGKAIANRTRKIFFKDKTMFIEITSAPLKHELSLSKSKMLQLIEKEFGKDIVADIVFL